MNKITAAGYGPLIKREGNVFNKYGEPLADSREVAESLGVDHSQLVGKKRYKMTFDLSQKPSVILIVEGQNKIDAINRAWERLTENEQRRVYEISFHQI